MIIALSILAVMIFSMAMSIVIPMLTTPYRRPTGMVRDHILRITPLGTSIEDVVSILEDRDDFGPLHIDFEQGFRAEPVDRHAGMNDMGEMLVSTGLGRYRAWYRWFPLMTWSVGATWIFDGDGNLIEVYVRRLGMI
jgi:hypothetical protein